MARDKEISQYDLGLVLKDVHDFDGQFLRVADVRSVISGYYSHFNVSYNVDNNPEIIEYYVGTQPHISHITFVNDNAGDLNNTYFTIRSNPDNQKYHIWFNVDNTGVDPAPIGSIGIEIPIAANDNSNVISYAVEYVIKNFYSGVFDAYRKNGSIEIRTRQFGIIDGSVDFNTGVSISNVQGDQRLVKKLEIEYSSGDPVYQGQVLKGYYFDVYSGKFEKSISVDIDDIDVAVGGHATRRTALVSEDYLNVDLDTTLFTEVISYTALENLKVRTLKVNGNTFGSYRVKINGIIQDYYQTSITQRNCFFQFSEDLLLNIGQVLTIEFVPDRIQLVNFNFFMRMESYI